jgi:phosphopantetheine--protein transferase-like protein
MTECAFEVDLWVFRPGDGDFEPFPLDVARAACIPDEERRIFAARSRSLLRRVLALRLGLLPEELEMKTRPGGKPFVDGCEFSISHSGPWLVVVTGGVELGVDVETRIPQWDAMDLAHRFFSEGDAAALGRSQNKPRDFLGQWVAKEAALKAAGVGIAGGLRNARCVFEGSAIREVAWDAERFAIHEFALGDGTPGAIARWHGLQTAIRWREAAEAAIS